MGILNNLQTMVYQAAQLIKTDSGVRNLLYYTTADALSKTAVDINAINDYIFLAPVFDTTKEPFNKSCFITLTITKVRTDDEDKLLDSILRINVLCENSLWAINSSKIRVVEISDSIVSKLNGTKLKTSHKLNFQGMELVVLDKNISGYALLFNITEGGGLQDEF
jgi:hypothetical protein